MFDSLSYKSSDILRGIYRDSVNKRTNGKSNAFHLRRRSVTPYCWLGVGSKSDILKRLPTVCHFASCGEGDLRRLIDEDIDYHVDYFLRHEMFSDKEIETLVDLYKSSSNVPLSSVSKELDHVLKFHIIIQSWFQGGVLDDVKERESSGGVDVRLSKKGLEWGRMEHAVDKL